MQTDAHVNAFMVTLGVGEVLLMSCYGIAGLGQFHGKLARLYL